MGGKPRLDTAEFIRRALERHGDKCDYSAVEYIDYKTPVQITCHLCGNNYSQPPIRHLRTDGYGWGCKVCGRKIAVEAAASKSRGKASFRRKSTEQFVADGRALHGNQVDYSKVKYKTAWIPVTLICMACGTEYAQTPHSHLAKRTTNGWGCPTCNLEARVASYVKARKGKPAANRKTTETFIAESRAWHGENAYDYSRCQYHGAKSPVELRCKKCGHWFKQLPTNHLRKGGCIFCSYEDRGRRHRLTFEEFVQKARNIHGQDKYRYFRDTYTTGKKRMKILCLEHGTEFWQSPDAHMAGKTACTFCQRISKSERAIYDWLEKHHLHFVYQQCFRSCRDQRPLPFDFFLPNQRLLIEYDGEHHFKEFYSSVKEVQRRDAIKTQWAEKNGYRLARIPYWDATKIPSILHHLLFRNG